MKNLSMLAMTLFLLVSAAQPSMAQTVTRDSFRTSRLILRVRDLATSVAFYRDRVGLTLQSVNGEFATFDAGGMTLMIEGLAQAPAAASTGLAALTEIALESGDVFATYAALKDRGIVFRSEPRIVTTDGSRNLYAADFRDPNGHIISISGWVGDGENLR